MVENKNGEKFFVTCKRDVMCWELTIRTQTNERVGFLRFASEDADSVKIFDFRILDKFWRSGIGTQMFSKLFDLFKAHGFSSVVGSCKSSERPLSEKEELAKWYMRLGFTLARKKMRGVPGYMGKLQKKL